MKGTNWQPMEIFGTVIFIFDFNININNDTQDHIKCTQKQSITRFHPSVNSSVIRFGKQNLHESTMMQIFICHFKPNISITRTFIYFMLQTPKHMKHSHSQNHFTLFTVENPNSYLPSFVSSFCFISRPFQGP